MTPLEPLPANKLFASLETSENNWSPTLSITLDELINDLTSEGKHPVLTGLRILGDPKTGQTKKKYCGDRHPYPDAVFGFGRLQKGKN
ncbi:hypothetical protein HMSSN139_54140 [Paenibacillus sp. HMSSN-139]|nr:hypothetical protein HMSSN139_54140 [Paenibacillus sp. HMSSN-139]